MKRCLARLVWLITVSRNSIVLIVTSLIAYYLIEVKGIEDVIEVTGQFISPSTKDYNKERLVQYN